MGGPRPRAARRRGGRRVRPGQAQPTEQAPGRAPPEVYVGTLLPYFVAFYQLRIADERSIADAEVSFWIIDSFFYIDLVLNFFFTYEDASGLEVFDLRKIAKRYLTGRFFLDLIACMPVAFWGAAVVTGPPPSGRFPKATRFVLVIIGAEVDGGPHGFRRGSLHAFSWGGLWQDRALLGVPNT